MFKNYRLIPITFLLCITAACVPINQDKVETNKQGQLVGINLEDTSVEYRQKTDELFQMVMQLDGSIDPVEARDLANSTVYRGLSLANEFELTWPPVWHNILVNYGYRPRGLCIHFCYDIITMLRDKNYQTMQFHWGIANEGSSYPLEHSSPVVTAIGQDFYAGVVLDAWRKSGDLVFAPVLTDKYEWHPFDESKLNVPKASRTSVPNKLKGGQQTVMDPE